MPKASAASTLTTSPTLSKHRPFGASRDGVPLTETGLMVIAGVGAAVVARLALENSTNVFGAAELLDHRFPFASKASAQGDCMEPLPSSLRITFGVRSGVTMPVAGTIGSCAAVNSTIVVPAA